jgi:hypothetical protein
MAIEFTETSARIEHGKLRMSAGEVKNFARAVAQFAAGFVTVRVERAHRRRTDGQNRFWHGVVIPLFAEHCGESFDEMKRTLALELIPQETKRLDGSIVISPGHTADLNVAQFNDLIQRAQKLGAEMDIYIPDPNEVAA